MLSNLKWNSIRWKIIIIYLLLVFIATTIIGVFIVRQLDDYYSQSTVKSVRTEISHTGILESNRSNDELKQIVDTWDSKLDQDVFVLDLEQNIIAEHHGLGGIGYDKSIAELALSGQEYEENGEQAVRSITVPVKNMALPLVNENDEVRGALYLRTDITAMYDILDEAKSIFITAMIIALIVTAVLGYFISRSITVPINYVTEQAEKMLEGDFSQEIDVHTEDEIGHMAKVFDLLRIELDANLSEISSEKNKLATILKHMADGLIAVDLDGNITHANEAARTMFRLTDDDLENKNYNEIAARFHNKTLDDLLDYCVDGAVESNFIYGGATYNVRFDRYKDEDGKDTGIILILQDITERQKIENMQKDFVANVSHELKTPLTTMKSYTETLIDGGVDDHETTIEFLEIIDAEIDRMNRLVKDLLQLSRLNYKQQKWYKKEGNIVSLVRHVTMKMDMMAKSKDQHLNTLFNKDDIILVDMDRDKIEQVIQNILSNAIKYTDKGGRIDIEIIKERFTVKVIIGDNGIGIPEDELSRVYERFFRVDKARSRAMGGTGLGLSISKQIVEEHKGTIDIESQLNRGTIVTIKLPLAPFRGKPGID